MSWIFIPALFVLAWGHFRFVRLVKKILANHEKAIEALLAREAAKAKPKTRAPKRKVANVETRQDPQV